MAHFSTAVVQANEVVKAHDFTHGFDSLINNVSLSLAMALESRQDFVINGMVKPYATGGMNVSVAPIFGLSYATGVPFGDTAMIGPVSISRASEQDRIDIIQIQGAYQEYDEQQREFLDFETKIRTFQSVFTKKRMIVNVVLKSGVPGSVAAPLTDDGFVKLAEIYVPARTLEITSDNIRNISSDIQGIPNELWTSEKSRTYNIGYISDVNKRYRVQHNADGTHKKNIIGIDQLNAGTESGQVSGINIPTGGEIPINNGKIGATVSLLESLKTLSAKITDFFTVYLQYGALDFKGELSISSIADESNALVNALKIGADGEGTAYLKIGNKTVFTITKDGVMRMATGYAASAKTDLITKAVTDTIASNLESLSDDFEEFKRTTEYTVYSNNLLSRYSIGQTLYAATTAQISLAGLQLIDGVTLSAGVLVLVKNQTDLKQNGIYEVNANNWQRHSSYATAEGIKYTLFPIGNGTQNKGHLFYTPKDTFIINTDEIPFADSIYAIEALPYKLGLRDDGGHLISSAPTAANHTARKAEVDAEATARANADSTLQNNINNEATARTNADNSIQGNLNSHAGNRSNPHGVTKAQVGLGSADNTADANKLSAFANQLQAFTNDNFTGGDHYVKAIRDNNDWAIRLWGSYAKGAKQTDSVSVNYANSAGWAGSAGNADTLDGYHAGGGVNQLVPVIAANFGESSGYVKYANGLLIQFGRFTTLSGTPTIVIFPQTHISVVYGVFTSQIQHLIISVSDNVSDVTLRDFKMNFRANTADYLPCLCSWFSIGI